MKWELWGETKSGVHRFICAKYKVEAAEARQEQEERKGEYEQVWIKPVED